VVVNVITYGTLSIDVHRFAEMFMLGPATRVAIWESCAPPLMYNVLKDRIGSLTLLSPQSESIEKAGNLKLLSFDEIWKKKPRPELDVWIVFDPDNMGMPNFLPEYAQLSLKNKGRVIVIKRKTLVPTIQMATLNAMFTNEGFEHVGALDLNPYFMCDVFYKRMKK
jgi:hypothetical protein